MSAAPRTCDAEPAATCPRCGAIVACGYLAGAGDCWCGAFAPVPPVRPANPAHCLCPDCLLDTLVAAGLASRWPCASSR